MVVSGGLTGRNAPRGHIVVSRACRIGADPAARPGRERIHYKKSKSLPPDAARFSPRFGLEVIAMMRSWMPLLLTLGLAAAVFAQQNPPAKPGVRPATK